MKVICDKAKKYPKCHECPHSKEHEPIGKCNKAYIKCSPNIDLVLTVNTLCTHLVLDEYIKKTV